MTAKGEQSLSKLAETVLHDEEAGRMRLMTRMQETYEAIEKLCGMGKPMYIDSSLIPMVETKTTAQSVEGLLFSDFNKSSDHVEVEHGQEPSEKGTYEVVTLRVNDSHGTRRSINMLVNKTTVIIHALVSEDDPSADLMSQSNYFNDHNGRVPLPKDRITQIQKADKVLDVIEGLEIAELERLRAQLPESDNVE